MISNYFRQPGLSKIDALIAITVCSVFASSVMFVYRNQPSAQAPSSPAVDMPAPTPGANLQAVTGQVACLPHKDTSGPQTLECAMGIKTSDGAYYAVRDAPQITQYSTTDSVTVTGYIAAPSATETYGIAGTITATVITKAQ